LNLTVLRESWRLHPLAWIHRSEARFIAEELRRVGYAVRLRQFREDSVSKLRSGPFLLRVSDPVMFAAVKAFACTGTQYIGPSAAVMERCYDKYRAYCIASANGLDCPRTTMASDAAAIPFPLVLKPRRGSDSIGVRIHRQNPFPISTRTEDYIAQEHVRGAEFTIAVLHGRVGMPLRIFLPEGTLYSFSRKYLLRPARAAVRDGALAERIYRTALKIAKVFGVDWAARIDLIQETITGRLCFIECDVAPLLGAQSAFAASLEAAGIGRTEQLRLLLSGATP
jgi:D-alanine-D-alanine ligase-like ATP-grasp enzyme